MSRVKQCIGKTSIIVSKVSSDDEFEDVQTRLLSQVANIKNQNHRTFFQKTVEQNLNIFKKVKDGKLVSSSIKDEIFANIYSLSSLQEVVSNPTISESRQKFALLK